MTEMHEKQKVKRKNWTARLAFFSLAAVFLLVAGYASVKMMRKYFPGKFVFPLSELKKNTFVEKFSGKTNQKIEETGKMSRSSNENWWVNSGGWLEMSDGVGKTIQGDLSADNKWHSLYKESNPKDTDNGSHPQNIFRLVTRKKWQNFHQQVFFQIRKINLSQSDNRNESNGMLLFNRYQDSDDLYYTGLRVDGFAVIKKKIKGDYHTLAQEKIFAGEDYNRDINPNLLPLEDWIGLRTEVKTDNNGDVAISLYYQMGRNDSQNAWKLAASCTDKGQKGDRILKSGYGGIRTDFMDVEFADYKIEEL